MAEGAEQAPERNQAEQGATEDQHGSIHPSSRPHEGSENAQANSYRRWLAEVGGFFRNLRSGQKTCFEAALLEQTWIGGPIAAARSAGTVHSEFELQPGHSGHV